MYYFSVTTKKFSKSAANRINKAIKKIDPTAYFSGPLSIPGSATTGWVERPNDGTNNYNHVVARNAQIAEIVDKELGV